MHALSLASSLGPNPRILCLGAHCDDIEIGCGGTVLELSEQIPGCEWSWVVFSGDSTRHGEARAGAKHLLGSDATVDLQLESFRDGYFPYQGAEIKDVFEKLKNEFQPDLILTHFSADKHQDHRLIAELTRNTWRDHLILEYEIPKYDGDLEQPQSYFCFDRLTAEKKTAIILETYVSQKKREWFDADVLMALMRLRGVEANSPGLYAEAFHAPKWTLCASSGDRA